MTKRRSTKARGAKRPKLKAKRKPVPKPKAKKRKKTARKVLGLTPDKPVLDDE
jgi:hypothetical protein